jgi:hypothetical protein
MKTTPDDLLAVRRRLKEDFPFYARNALKIRSKSGEILPLILKEAQMILHREVVRQLDDTGFVRVVVLKGRQQGLSTYVGGRMYWSVTHRIGAKALVMAHKLDSTNALFTMVHRYHKNCPPHLRLETSNSSKRELVFPNIDGAYMVATAGGDAVGRGETITHFHGSEVGLWPRNSAAELWAGLSQSISNAPGTEVYLESTARGNTGVFFDMHEGAVRGENGYSAVFVPWFLEKDYWVAPPFDFEPTLEELEMVEAYPLLSPGHLYWRRQKIAETSAEMFQQEYPCNPKEAFLTSGRPVFDAIIIDTLREQARKMEPAKMTLEGTGFTYDRRGELTVFQQPRSGREYVIGADVSKGLKGGDYSVAQVLDQHRNQVAVWRGHVLPDQFAEVLNHLGMWYNGAKLIVENNDHGVLTCYLLHHHWTYPNLYSTVTVDKETLKHTETLGFSTNAKTRPLILDGLRAAVRDQIIGIYDTETLSEMSTFVVNDAGKMEADGDKHDDCVMSLAIAYHGTIQLSHYIPPADEHYEETYF